MIITKTPFRITLAGGGTDLPSYYQKYGGKVLSMAINKYIYITIKSNEFDNNIKLRYSENEDVEYAGLLKHDRAREALYANNIIQKLEIVSTADLPARSGMGSSGSFLVALIAALKNFNRQQYTLRDICEEACDIEINKLKLPVGKQDQYIAGYGGIHQIVIDTSGKVEMIDNSHFDITQFIKYISIYKLNQYRDAPSILKDQNKNIYQMKDIADMTDDFIKVLSKNDFYSYGKMLDEYWKLKKKLSNKISNTKVDEIYKDAKKFGIYGGKIIGAGGGGFLMLFGPKNVRLDEVLQYKYDIKEINFEPDYFGLRVSSI